MNFEIRTEIAAPPELVWSVIEDVERWPAWTESMSRVERLDDAPFAEGSEARVEQPRVPATIWRVTALEPGHAFTWEGSTRGIHSVASHTIEPSGEGSRLTLAMHQSGPMAWLMRPWLRSITRRYVKMEAEGLRTHCEAKSREARGTGEDST